MMAKRNGLITLGRIDPNPEQPKPPRELADGGPKIEKKAENQDQKSLEVSYLQKQIASYEVYRQMMAAEKNTEEYKKLREKWLEKREEIINYDKKMEEKLPASDWETYQTNYNLSEDKARKKLQELGVPMPDVESSPDLKIVPAEVDSDKKDNAWKSLWGLRAGEKLPKDVTEKDVRKYIEMKKSSLTTLSQAYAENLLNDLDEEPVRENAEEHRSEIEDLEAEESQIKEELRAEKNKVIGVLEEPNDPEISRLEKGLEEKQQIFSAEKKKAIWGEKFKKGVKSFFDKFKKEEKKLEGAIVKEKEKTPEEKIASGEEYLDESGFIHNQKEGKGYKKVNDFLAERAKGFVGGFGWWESHQAEKFRKGTKEMGRDAKIQARLLEQDSGMLDFDDAWKEAHEVEKGRAKEEVVFKEKYGVGEKEARYAAIMWLNDKISRPKKEYNQKVEDNIVSMAMAKLEEKIGGKEWFGAYKAANGGRALTLEKAEELEKKMREKIGELRKGQSKKDLVDFIKLSRQSLDKNWWHRYIYTAVDAVLAGLLLKWVIGKYLGGKVIAGGEEIVAKEGEKVVAETGLKDTIWGEAKRMLIKEGVANPTNVQIQQVATEIAKDSGVKVISKASGEVIWQATGAGTKGVDIALGKGFLLKLAGGIKKIALIKASLGI